MKFIIDAQLPRKLAIQLKDEGHDVRHTLSLPQGNRTSDQIINEISIQEQRIVITKDADFVDSFIIQKEPWKLLLISTGNIHNNDLLTLFATNLNEIQILFNNHQFIEISQEIIIVHS